MATITMDKSIAEDLVNTKLSLIRERIDGILTTWNYKDVDLFLQDARTGTIEEAEMDAISLTNLLDQREKYFKLKELWVED